MSEKDKENLEECRKKLDSSDLRIVIQGNNFLKGLYYFSMNKGILRFGDIQIEKRKFHYSKYPTDIKNVNHDKIMIPSKVSFGKKDFIYFI